MPEPGPFREACDVICNQEIVGHGNYPPREGDPEPCAHVCPRCLGCQDCCKCEHPHMIDDVELVSWGPVQYAPRGETARALRERNPQMRDPGYKARVRRVRTEEL